VLAEPRETADQLLRSVHEQYCGDWFFAERLSENGPILSLLTPATLGEAPCCTVYPDREQAIAADNDDNVFQSFSEKRLPIETNQLFVHGREPVSGRPIIVKIEDTESQDPTLLVTDRPDNWTGTIRKAALNAPGLRSQEAVEAAASKLWKKAGYARWGAEIVCPGLLISEDTNLPVWVGDVIEVIEHADYRVQGLRLDLWFEVAGYERRFVTYLLQKVQVVENDSKGLGYTRQKSSSLIDLILATKRYGVMDPVDSRSMRRPPYQRSQVTP
jgi:hypothetical protein